MSWKEARIHCKSKNANADLAEIRNEETNAFLLDILRQKSFNFWWIGGSDEAQVRDPTN